MLPLLLAFLKELGFFVASSIIIRRLLIVLGIFLVG
jgi:hypothetical protein